MGVAQKAPKWFILIPPSVPPRKGEGRRLVVYRTGLPSLLLMVFHSSWIRPTTLAGSGT